MQNTILIATLGAIAAQASSTQLEAEWGSHSPAYGGSYNTFSAHKASNPALTTPTISTDDNHLLALRAQAKAIKQRSIDAAVERALQQKLIDEEKAKSAAEEKARKEAEEKAKLDKIKRDAELAAFKKYEALYGYGYGSSLIDFGRIDNVC